MMKKIEYADLVKLGAGESAISAYNSIDPLDIYELPDGCYQVTGAYEYTAGNAEDLIEYLDSLGEACNAMNDQYSAAALYDGGWRSSDAEQLQSEYDLTAEETAEIVEALREIENSDPN